MPRFRSSAVLPLIAAFLVACTSDAPVSPRVPNAQTPQQASATQGVQASAVPGAFVVALKNPSRATEVRQMAESLGATVRAELPAIGALNLSALSPSAALALSKSPDVERVDQDYLVPWIPKPITMSGVRARTVTNPVRALGTDQTGAFFYDYQWNMRQIKADRAWKATPAGKGELVCILDSGIDPSHVDLMGKVDLTKTKSFVSAPLFPGDLEIFDYNFHGTWVAGIISSNGLGVASVAPDAQLCALKVLRVDGNGSFGDVIAALVYAGQLRADVINMSLGTYIDSDLPGVEGLMRELQLAINYATNQGSLVVAAAGNDGVDLDHDAPSLVAIPAQLQNVVSVGATAPINRRNYDMLASYSNYGGRTGTDIFAPGGDFVQGSVVTDLVFSACSSYQMTLPFTCTPQTFVFDGGTSAAAPHVSGAAAVVKSQLGAATPQTLERCLKRGADPLAPETVFGTGRLNVLKAAACT